MGDWFLGEIRLFAFGSNTIPRGWVPCDGRILQIQQNTALYSIIGNYFGGDGKATFAVPDLRGRVAVHPQTVVPPRTLVDYGKTTGEETHQLIVAEVPSHIHQAQANTQAGTTPAIASNIWAAGASQQNIYGVFPDAPVSMDDSVVSPTGGGLGHNNMQPFLALNYCIATQGIYPPRS